MSELSLSCGEEILIKASCEPSPVTVQSSDGVYPPVDVFVATNGMKCPRVMVKKSHDDPDNLDSNTTFLVGYSALGDEDDVCLVLDTPFPDRRVHIRPDRGSGTPVDTDEIFGVYDFAGDSLYIHLDSVLAGFTAEQLKAAMTPAMRTALAAILP